MVSAMLYIVSHTYTVCKCLTSINCSVCVSTGLCEVQGGGRGPEGSGGAPGQGSRWSGCGPTLWVWCGAESSGRSVLDVDSCMCIMYNVVFVEVYTVCMRVWV